MKYSILICIFDLLLFQNCICRIFPKFSMFDEIICIIFTLAMLLTCSLRPNKIKNILKKEKEAILLLAALIIIGLVGNAICKYQYNITAILKDIMSLSKFIVVYISSLIIFMNIDKEILLRKIARRSRIFIMVFFFFALVNLICDIGMGYDIRSGIRTYKFIYSHPTYLVISTIVMMCILIAEGRESNKAYIGLALSILLFSGRSKAIMFILLYLFIELVWKNIEKIKLYQLAFIIGIASTIFIKKIMDYFSYGYTSARPALYLIGLEIARKNLPIGSGFGTFASSISAKYYSKAYIVYKLNTVWGMSKDDYSYIADTFWPYIYGQFGILGFCIFVLIIYNLYNSIRKRYSYSKCRIKAINLLMVYILISSIAEAIFIDSTGTFIFVVFAVFLGSNNLRLKKSYCEET